MPVHMSGHGEQHSSHLERFAAHFARPRPGADLHVPLTQTSQTQQWMQAAIAQGDGELDYAAIIRVVERSAGLTGEA